MFHKQGNSYLYLSVDAKREGDGCTPSGIYTLELAFGKEIKLHTGLPYRQTLDDDIWVDDVAATDYNRRVKMPSTAGSYERMRRSDGLYDLGATKAVNPPLAVLRFIIAMCVTCWSGSSKTALVACKLSNKEQYVPIFSLVCGIL